MERISGPFDGFYVAAYTTELEGLFYGYAKLCTKCPDDVWSADTRLKIGTWEGEANEEAALQAAEETALRVISELQSPGTGFLSGLFPL